MLVTDSSCGLCVIEQMSQRTVIPLDRDWKFRNACDDCNSSLPVSQFPTNIHLDLCHHVITPDPYFAKTEKTVQWVGEQTWIYKTSFSVPEHHASRAVLVFQGLDTYAKVRLNGREILKTQNAFTPERVDVTQLLQKSSCNWLEITFHSAIAVGKKIIKKYPKHHWGCWNGDISRLAVRKPQYHYVRLPQETFQSYIVNNNRLGMGLGSKAHDLWAIPSYKLGDL